MTPVAARRAPVTVRTEGAAVVLELSDNLDATVGPPWSTPPTAAVAAAPERLDIDLRKAPHLDPRRGHRPGPLPGDLHRPADGLHYRTGRGPGRDALLAAYSG